MAATMPDRRSSAHRVISEIRPEMAKADLRISEKRDFLAEIGACLNAARNRLGWNLDELAQQLDRDPRQVRRWITGEERTQVDVVFGVPALREHFVIALAALADCEVETVVRIRRPA